MAKKIQNVVAAPAVVEVDATVPPPVDDASSNTTAVEQPPVVVVPENDIVKVYESLIATSQTLLNSLKDHTTDLKNFQKDLQKLVKSQNKTKKATKTPNASGAPRAQSGFAKPSRLSDELCEFLQVPLGTEKARTEVTKLINAYIIEHNLQNPENRRNIIPDAALKKLMRLDDSTVLNYFNLQSHLKTQFVKKDPVPAAEN